MNTKEKTEFKNIRQVIVNKFNTELKDRLKTIEELTEKEQIKKHWMYSNLLTKNIYNKMDEYTLEQLKEKMIKKANKNKEKDLKEAFEQLEKIENADLLENAVITVEWKKSAMWGSNPTAELRTESLTALNQKRYDSIKGRSISGCGYCKESTAVAQVLNESMEVLKVFCEIMDKNINEDLRNFIGYGISYNYYNIPTFNGGVGVNCYYHIFEKAGYKMEKTAWGKMFDVYSINKL